VRVDVADQEEKEVNCLVSVLFSLLVVPSALMRSPGLATSVGDSTRFELGADLSFLNPEEYGGVYCGFGFRLGYQWRDYVLLEGEYSHHGDPYAPHERSVFLAAAGPRVGLRERGLGWFFKLQPGIVHDLSFAEFRFALSVGAVMEAHLDTVGRETPAYIRFDVGHLIMRDGDGIVGQVSQHPGAHYPRSSVGIVFRF